MRPLDHPTPDRPHRIYVALTNHCNRSCPWCSTCSSPRGGTFFDPADLPALLPRAGRFQLQLEGGEPTVHPKFWQLVTIARAHPGCDRLILCTNGTLIPRSDERLHAWLDKLGTPLTIKISVNHHLLDEDSGLIELCLRLRDELAGRPDCLLVINVRLRRGYEGDDHQVREAVERAGLISNANIFFLQAYGFAKDEVDWDPPHLVADRFTLINPDGKAFGPDLIARSEAMRVLP